jgi:SpoVK/Ycf46/Vps4 family AAA+-type ATPase
MCAIRHDAQVHNRERIEAQNDHPFVSFEGEIQGSFSFVALQRSGGQEIDMSHFQQALKTVLPSCLRSSLGRTDLAPVSWEQIGGLQDVKLKLIQVRCDTLRYGLLNCRGFRNQNYSVQFKEICDI